MKILFDEAFADGTPYQNDNVLDHVRMYQARGWAPIPVAPRTKQPFRDAWTESTPQTGTGDFHPDSNIALNMGRNSGGLVAIDLDCPEAVKAAPFFLPETGLKFGRSSEPTSHWSYLVRDCQGKRSYKFPGGGGIDLLADGSCCVVPPSVYDNGERSVFDTDGEPTVIGWDELLSCVGKVAACALLAQHWFSNRHDCSIPLAGALAAANWPEDDARSFIEAVCLVASDEEEEDRLLAVKTTYERYLNGETVSGLPALERLLGREVVSSLSDWLNLRESKWGGIGHNRPPSDEAVQFTDIGNTDRFCERYGKDAAYAPALGWLAWNGSTWAMDADASVHVWAERLIREIVTEARMAGRGHLGSRASVKNVVDLAMYRLTVDPGMFDRNPWMLNCTNGTVDLKSGELRPHRREDFITKSVLVAYNPKATAPKFLEFLAEIMEGDAAMVSFLQRALGYSLTGSMREQCLFICHGTGRNGKSTLLNLFEKLLCGYAMNAPLTTFLAKKNDGGVPNDVARLKGARFVTASEGEQSGHRLAVPLLKRLTGEDSITARYLHKEWFTFPAQLKLWMPTNFKPTFDGADRAMAARLRMVPFTYVVPADKRDGDLPSKLEAEAEGILAWAVQGCLEWQRAGLIPPDKVVAATQAYQEAMDSVAQFVAECLEVTPKGRIGKSEMAAAFEAWAKETGVEGITTRALPDRLKQFGIVSKRSGSKRYWAGANLLASEWDGSEPVALSADTELAV